MRLIASQKINYEAQILTNLMLNDEIEEKNQLKKRPKKALGLTC